MCYVTKSCRHLHLKIYDLQGLPSRHLPAFTIYWYLTTETLEQGVKDVQSQQ